MVNSNEPFPLVAHSPVIEPSLTLPCRLIVWSEQIKTSCPALTRGGGVIVTTIVSETSLHVPIFVAVKEIFTEPEAMSSVLGV